MKNSSFLFWNRKWRQNKIKGKKCEPTMTNRETKPVIIINYGTDGLGGIGRQKVQF